MRREPEAGTAILTYHSVGRDASRRFRPFTVTGEQFEEQMREIRDGGYDSLTVSDFVMRRRAGRLPEKCVVVTFDDGFADFFTMALPILCHYRVAATLYVVSGCVGGRAQWLAGAGEDGRPILDWAQLAEISRSGIEIGAHSVSHPALDLLPEAEARHEIVVSKQEIEDRLGRRVASFAYPFGFRSPAVTRLVAESGYDSACAVRYGNSGPDDDRFALTRHIILRDTTARDFAATLAGRAPWLAQFARRTRSGAGSVVRRAMRRLQ